MRVSEGDSDGQKDLVEIFPLEYEDPSGSKTTVGSLKIIASYANIDRRLVGNATVILTTTTVQTLLAGIFILLIIYLVLTRHLVSMANYAEHTDIGTLDTPLEVNRLHLFKSKPDELDRLAKAFDDVRIRVKSYLDDRQRAVAALRENEQELLDSQWKLNAIINNHFQFTGLLDLDGRLQVVNKTALEFAGIDEKEVVGQLFWDTVWWNHSSEVQAQLKNTIRNTRNGQTIHESTTHKNALGEIRHVNFTMKPVTDDDGKTVYLLAEGRDITEEKNNQEELKKYQEHLEDLVEERTREANKAKEVAEEARQTAETANRAKSAFLANMSHELRTPLNAILGYSQLMQRDTSLKDRQKERLANINRSGKHLLELINDVLEMAKIESGHSEFQEKDIDLFDLLETMQKSFSLRAEEKRLKLIFERSEAVPQYIFTDGGKLRQIMFNLISNAIKFTDTGEVKVYANWDDTTTSKSELYFEVHDTGPGIEPDEIKKLFSAFEQTSAGKRKEEGTGLGLAISQNFARLMDGKITVDSREDVGSIFKLQIKTEVSKSRSLKKPIHHRRVKRLKPDQKKYQILVVDDQEDNRQVLAHQLESVGFVVREAKNGLEGVRIHQSWPADLIFMDMRMPEMDGYEATRTIKKEAGRNAPPIIAVTASAFEEERANVLAAGCDDYIRKPALEVDIYDSLAQHLGVEFDYEADDQDVLLQKELSQAEPLTAESLAELPDDLRAELKTRSLELDQQAMGQLIQKIRLQGFARIANSLESLVAEFQFEKINNLV